MFALQDYQRYGRQMILDDFGLPGQLKLQRAAVVVVGAGGLGCPALQYLGASGIGRIGIIDHDRVELSNLQRQILHTEATIGMYKAESAALALKRINSNLIIDVITTALTPENALSLLGPYDIILDCTDNSPTRYLLSDAAVALRRPLISGAAQKYEGQMCVYNLGEKGPCYRCLFPIPSPKETLGSCEESGILGVVTGIIGNMQALETIKLISGLHDQRPSMLIFSAVGFPPFRTIKLRPRQATCPCSNPDRNPRSITNTDYVQFCGGPMPDWVAQGTAAGYLEHRIQPKDLEVLRTSKKPLQIIDVRSPTEYGICQLSGSIIIDVPLKDLILEPEKYLPTSPELDTYIICRLGNDSQIAAESLRQVKGARTVKDVIGGLKAWSKQVDPHLPQY